MDVIKGLWGWFRGWPTWVQAITGVLVLFIFIGAVSGGSDSGNKDSDKVEKPTVPTLTKPTTQKTPTQEAVTPKPKSQSLEDEASPRIWQDTDPDAFFNACLSNPHYDIYSEGGVLYCDDYDNWRPGRRAFTSARITGL